MLKDMIILLWATLWCCMPAATAEDQTAETRVTAVQKAAVASSPSLRSELYSAQLRAQEVRSEAAAINPYIEWQSEGLGSERTLNAQDTLRVGTEFNFFGQMGPARRLAETSEEALPTIRSAAIRATAVEATQRWIELAAAVERLEVRKARLEKLDTALALLEARHQLGEVAGSEVAQLDLEHTDAASIQAAAETEVAVLSQAVAELCGTSFPKPIRGDLEVLATVSRSPEAHDIRARATTSGVPMMVASTEAAIEEARAKMAAASAWGRPMIEAEWERFPDLGPVPGYDAWGFRVALPLPLGSVGARQRAAAREREALAVASKDAALRQSLSRAEAALAVARGAESRLVAMAPTLKTLPRLEESLFAQFRLGVLTYSEYVFATVRHDEIRLRAINAHVDLLLARLRLSYLADDPSVFPTAEMDASEDS